MLNLQFLNTLRGVVAAGAATIGSALLPGRAAAFAADQNVDDRAHITLIRERPDLILLDVNMPKMNGLEACREIRLSFAGPIIMVTVHNSVNDKIVALDSGADDCVVKPFAMGELLARIRAALRRTSSEEPLPKIETPELSLDLEKRMVNVRSERVHLSPKEFDVLRLLVIHEGMPLTHKRILQAVWGPDHSEETENLRVVINQLRKKIERDPAHPRYIVTEPGSDIGCSSLAVLPKNDLATRRDP